MWSGPAMSRRNPVASRRRRLPYVAKIKRDDPFAPDDEREIAAMCRRIAAASEFMVLAGWREDAGFRVFHFPTWAKARAMQHSIDRSGIAGRPMPKLGETTEERAEQQREALAWASVSGRHAPENPPSAGPPDQSDPRGGVSQLFVWKG